MLSTFYRNAEQGVGYRENRGRIVTCRRNPNCDRAFRCTCADPPGLRAQPQVDVERLLPLRYPEVREVLSPPQNKAAAELM